MAGSPKRKSPISAFTLIVVILTLAAMVGALWLLNTGVDSGRHLETLENKIRTFRQLSTVKQTYRSVIYVEEKNFWRGNKQLLFTLEYNVTAGVDFTKGIEINQLPDGVIEVRMPEAEVFSWDADESTIRELFLREAPLFNPVRLGDYMPQVIAEGEANRQAALDNGIIERAEANARMAIVKVLELGKLGPVVFGSPLVVPPDSKQISEDDDDS